MIKQCETPSKIIQRIFSNASLQGGTSTANEDKAGKFLVLSGQYGPRWIIPSQPRFGLPVLKQWHPYNFTSRIKWACLLFLYSKGLLRMIPGINVICLPSAAEPRLPGNTADLIPVVYVGTPGPQQKGVVTLVDPESCTPLAVMKVALSEGAKVSLLHEAKILEKLAAANLYGTPALLGIEENGMRTWQTVITGPLTNRKLTQAHIDWLLRLPRTGKTTTLEKQQPLIRKELQKELPGLGTMDKQTLSAAVDMLQGQERLPRVLVHGDFTPWNLKRQTDGKIAAIDWEEASLDGLPLWDICHFYFMQAHLFCGSPPIRQLTANSLVGCYLHNMGVSIDALNSLLILYILSMIIDKRGNRGDTYRTFLLKQLLNLLN